MAKLYEYPQLDPKNFSSWKFRVLTLLEEKDVKEQVVSEIDITTMMPTKDQKEFKRKDATARSTITKCIPDLRINVVFHVIKFHD